jgi:hypothetical protein
MQQLLNRVCVKCVSFSFGEGAGRRGVMWVMLYYDTVAVLRPADVQADAISGSALGCIIDCVIFTSSSMWA